MVHVTIMQPVHNICLLVLELAPINQEIAMHACLVFYVTNVPQGTNNEKYKFNVLSHYSPIIIRNSPIKQNEK